MIRRAGASCEVFFAAVLSAVVSVGGCAQAQPLRVSGTRVLGTPTQRAQGAISDSRGRWLIIAPHPDDEALTGSGVLLHAVSSGANPAVIVMTNGDWDCAHDGLVREAESVAALSVLGLPEQRVFFLGYPDGGLARLGRAPLPPMKRVIGGACVAGNTTYGARGFGQHDYHTVRFGSPASYTRDHAVGDLVSLLEMLRPTDVVITHPSDTHPDHAAAYALFRSALDRADLAAAPRVHRAMVHNGDCWPTGAEAREPCPPGGPAPTEPSPPLSGRLRGYWAGERIAVPASCASADRSANPKVRAIAAYASQTRGLWESYLFAFARKDEPFYPETFVRTGGKWTHADVARDGVGAIAQRLPIGRAAGAGPVTAPDGAATVSSGFELALSLSRDEPFSMSMDLLRPVPTPDGSVARLEFLADKAGHYALAIDAGQMKASLIRTFEGRPQDGIQEWELPHDLWSSARAERMRCSVELRPEEGPMAELSLWFRDELVGVAVDLSPRLHGEHFALSNVVTSDGTITLSTGPRRR